MPRERNHSRASRGIWTVRRRRQFHGKEGQRCDAPTSSNVFHVAFNQPIPNFVCINFPMVSHAPFEDFRILRNMKLVYNPPQKLIFFRGQESPFPEGFFVVITRFCVNQEEFPLFFSPSPKSVNPVVCRERFHASTFIFCLLLAAGPSFLSLGKVLRLRLLKLTKQESHHNVWPSPFWFLFGPNFRKSHYLPFVSQRIYGLKSMGGVDEALKLRRSYVLHRLRTHFRTINIAYVKP